MIFNILTIINSIVILIFLFKINITIDKITTDNKTLCGFVIYIDILKKYKSLSFTFKNVKKLNDKERAKKYFLDINSNDSMLVHNAKQSLHARCSWLKTNEEMEHFNKIYGYVSQDLVNEIIKENKEKLKTK